VRLDQRGTIVRQVTTGACKSGHRDPEPNALYWSLASWVLATPGKCPVSASRCSAGAFLHTQTETSFMLWLAIILVVAWMLGFGVFHVAGGLIHLLLVIALVVFLINFISGRRTV
jgi:Family of unknown function (DUF5670)